jgi:hypothetical protein
MCNCIVEGIPFTAHISGTLETEDNITLTLAATVGRDEAGNYLRDATVTGSDGVAVTSLIYYIDRTHKKGWLIDKLNGSAESWEFQEPPLASDPRFQNWTFMGWCEEEGNLRKNIAGIECVGVVFKPENNPGAAVFSGTLWLVKELYEVLGEEGAIGGRPYVWKATRLDRQAPEFPPVQRGTL